MEQLVMRWTNDGKEAEFPSLPDHVTVGTVRDRENGIDEWLDIVQYDLAWEPVSHDFYRKCMVGHSGYEDDRCFLFCLDGKAVATVCVICDREKAEGYIHMVGSKPEVRGRGIGNLMNAYAAAVLKKEGMKTAYLTTDDWRIPAIKSYLRADFVPDETTDDFRARWAKIRETIRQQ